MLPEPLASRLARREVCFFLRLPNGAILTRRHGGAFPHRGERIVGIIALGIAKPAPGLDAHTAACVRYLARAILGGTILPLESWRDMAAPRPSQGPMRKTSRPRLRLIRGDLSPLRRAP